MRDVLICLIVCSSLLWVGQANGQTPTAEGDFVLIPPVPSATNGWSCGDFPCADDQAGWAQRLQAPIGFVIDALGRLAGQPQQIIYGPDGRLYATVITDGTQRLGAVVALETDGTNTLIAGPLLAPSGLAFDRDGALYVSGRRTLTEGGVLWRVDVATGAVAPLISDLPCCAVSGDAQPNGLTLGADGWLYLGIGALTNALEPSAEEARRQPFASLRPYEASIVRIDPINLVLEPFAAGLRNPFDLAFAPNGVTAYATDQGILTGEGHRVVSLVQNGHYGWPFFRNRGCTICPPTDFNIPIQPDLLTLPNYSAPRGITVYGGAQFPTMLSGQIFFATGHGSGLDAGRVAMLSPVAALATPLATPAPSGAPSYGAPAVPFLIGLPRPMDVIVDAEGALVVVDAIYGQVWRVRYTG